MDVKVVTVLTVACFLLSFTQGQNEVCMFYHLSATCRYRIDGISLSLIKVTLDQCSDPMKVTFEITNEKPPVHFSYTFSSSDSTVTVRGFYQDVRLQVKMHMKRSDLLNIEADFHVYNMPRVDFMNDDIKLHSLEEACGSLNNAGKIAIGVMAGLFAIAAILLVVLLVIRHQRKVLKATQSRTVLVNEPEISETTPPRLPRIEENGDEENAQTLSSSVNRNSAQFQRDNFRNHHSPQREVNQVNMQDLQHNCHSPQREVNQVNMQNLQHNCHSPQREVNQVNMQDVQHDRTNIMNSAVRFSDISEPTVI